MIIRNIKLQIIQALSRQAVVAIIGPRQVGKTTLALEIGESVSAVYLDLEDINDRRKLDNAALFFESNEDKLVILDEIHRMPELFSTLRGVIDKGRRKNKAKGRFLILGSAAIDLLKQSETLAGRIAYINMNPLNLLEISANEQKVLWVRGGFPDSYLASTDKESFEIRKDFIKTYLERDVAMFGPRVPATTLERLWIMLSHLQGSILNASDIGRSLGVSTQSVTRYIDLLSDLLLIRRLTPFHVNVGKRLVKSPKVYIRDSGILHTLLGLAGDNQLLGHPVVGNSWEGFVIENIINILPWRALAFFYRTAAGAEIDLLIQFHDGKLWAIEIKYSPSAKISKGFYNAIEDLKPEKSFIVHNSQDQFPVAQDIRAIGLYDMLLEITKLT